MLCETHCRLVGLVFMTLGLWVTADSCRERMTLCADKCTNDCKSYDVPVGKCYNPQSRWPGDPQWGNTDVFDEIDATSVNRSFFASTDGTCRERTDGFVLPLDQCVGPFGKPRPWGTMSCVRELPVGPLILGYATACDPKVVVEAKLGVNVLIWFASNLVNETGKPAVEFGLNTTCIAQVAKQLREMNLPTTHLVSIGGWNAPHPSTVATGEEWFNTWSAWNTREVAHPHLGFHGFDGLDWDLEGNDDPKSPYNVFSNEVLELVGSMSLAAKRHGFLVTIVPPQSYFDVSTSRFDRSLLHAYKDYHPEFHYHGYNAYALLLAKFGSAGLGLPTFDLVDIQLYESWSRADQAIDGEGQAPQDYLAGWISALVSGNWTVDFAADPSVGVPSQTITVSPDQLIVGLSMGMGHGKSIFIFPEEVGRAFEALPAHQRPRGAMFWNLEIDGGFVNGTHTNCSFAAGLNAFLKDVCSRFCEFDSGTDCLALLQMNVAVKHRIHTIAINHNHLTGLSQECETSASAQRRAVHFRSTLFSKVQDARNARLGAAG